MLEKKIELADHSAKKCTLCAKYTPIPSPSPQTSDVVHTKEKGESQDSSPASQNEGSSDDQKKPEKKKIRPPPSSALELEKEHPHPSKENQAGSKSSKWGFSMPSSVTSGALLGKLKQTLENFTLELEDDFDISGLAFYYQLIFEILLLDL